MELETILNDLTEYLKANKPKYLYNQNFEAGKSQVLYSGPYWDEQEVMAAIKTLIDGKWAASGENIYKFEIAFGKKFGAKFCHMVNSGSSANLVMIAALKKYFGWKDGDTIIVSPVGFPTTISAIVQNGLVPVFVDIEWETLNFDLNEVYIKSYLSEAVAIFVSPVLGNPPNMDILLDICEKRKMKLIGDSCDSLGTTWNGKSLSDYYVAWTTSLYVAHHISTIEGGMCCTNVKELKDLFMSFSTWGRACYCVGSANMLACGTCQKRFHNWLPNYNGIIDHKYVFENMGYNLKPIDLQGSIGLVQLSKFDKIADNRRINKNRIESILIEYVKGIKNVGKHHQANPCWFGTPFICQTKEIKDKLVKFCEDNKIQTRNYFAGNILLHEGYSHLGDYNKYPEANKVLDKVFFLGAAPHYDEQVFNYIEETFKNKWQN